MRYHQIPERPPEQVYAAFLECFTAPAGQYVLDECYRLQLELPSGHELRQALSIVFPYFIDAMQRGEALRHGRRRDVDPDA
jgi:hypothetical protein